MKPHTIKMLNISYTILMSAGGKASQGANLSSTAKGNEAVSAIRWLYLSACSKEIHRLCFCIKNNLEKEGNGGHITKRTVQSHLTGSNCGSDCTIDFFQQNMLL